MTVVVPDNRNNDVLHITPWVSARLSEDAHALITRVLRAKGATMRLEGRNSDQQSTPTVFHAHLHDPDTGVTIETWDRDPAEAALKAFRAHTESKP